MSAEQDIPQVQSQVDSQASDLNGSHEESFEGDNLSDRGSVASRETTSQAPPSETYTKQRVSGYTVSPWDATNDSKAEDGAESHDITYWTGVPASTTSDDCGSGSEHDHVKGFMPTNAIADSTVEDDSVFADTRKYDPATLTDHLLRTGLPSLQTLSEATGAQAASAGRTVEPDESEKNVEASGPAQTTVGGQGGLPSLRDAKSLWVLARKMALESILAAGDQQNTNVPTHQVAEASAESDCHEPNPYCTILRSHFPHIHVSTPSETCDTSHNMDMLRSSASFGGVTRSRCHPGGAIPLSLLRAHKIADQFELLGLLLYLYMSAIPLLPDTASSRGAKATHPTIDSAKMSSVEAKTQAPSHADNNVQNLEARDAGHSAVHPPSGLAGQCFSFDVDFREGNTGHPGLGQDCESTGDASSDNDCAGGITRAIAARYPASTGDGSSADSDHLARDDLACGATITTGKSVRTEYEDDSDFFNDSFKPVGSDEIDHQPLPSFAAPNLPAGDDEESEATSLWSAQDTDLSKGVSSRTDLITLWARAKAKLSRVTRDEQANTKAHTASEFHP